MHLNIRGLISKQNELSTTIKNGYGTTKPIDIALLNETWLRKDTVNKVSMPGYTLHSRERVGKKGGGIGIFVANRLKCRIRSDLHVESDKLEHIVLEIKTRTTSLLLASGYRPPNADGEQFIKDYQKLVKSLVEGKQKGAGLVIGIGP